MLRKELQGQRLWLSRPIAGQLGARCASSSDRIHDRPIEWMGVAHLCGLPVSAGYGFTCDLSQSMPRPSATWVILIAWAVFMNWS